MCRRVYPAVLPLLKPVGNTVSQERTAGVARWVVVMNLTPEIEQCVSAHRRKRHDIDWLRRHHLLGLAIR